MTGRRGRDVRDIAHRFVLDTADAERLDAPLAGEMSAWPTTAGAVRGFRRWFIRLAWSTHRALCRVTGGRLGLWRPKPGRWGTLRLTTTGRRTGRPRSVIVGYLQDGPNLVTLAMNGWADPEPAWWLNLQPQPDATVELVGEARAVRAAAARGAERSRLWPAGPTSTGNWTAMRRNGRHRLRW
jgi:F420H(2)-dependent quinone reductase